MCFAHHRLSKVAFTNKRLLIFQMWSSSRSTTSAGCQHCCCRLQLYCPGPYQRCIVDSNDPKITTRKEIGPFCAPTPGSVRQSPRSLRRSIRPTYKEELRIIEHCSRRWTQLYNNIQHICGSYSQSLKILIIDPERVSALAKFNSSLGSGAEASTITITARKTAIKVPSNKTGLKENI